MKLISSDEAERSDIQHIEPCSDCPWRRDSLTGWLGGATVQEWLAAAHGDEQINCHTKIGPQCAGSAIYRANVCKYTRPGILRLSKNKEAVFGSPMEFTDHHKRKPKPHGAKP